MSNETNAKDTTELHNVLCMLMHVGIKPQSPRRLDKHPVDLIILKKKPQKLAAQAETYTSLLLDRLQSGRHNYLGSP